MIKTGKTSKTKIDPEKIPIIFHIKNTNKKLFDKEILNSENGKKFINLYYDEYKNMRHSPKITHDFLKHCAKHAFLIKDIKQIEIYKITNFSCYLYYLVRYENSKEKLISLANNIIYDEIDPKLGRRLLNYPITLLKGLSRNKHNVLLTEYIIKLYEKIVSLNTTNVNSRKEEYLETILKYGSRTGSLEFIKIFLKKYNVDIITRYKNIAGIHNVIVENSISRSYRNIYDYVLQIDVKNISEYDLTLWLGKSCNIDFIEEMSLEYLRDKFDVFNLIRRSMYGRCEEKVLKHFLNKLSDDKIDDLLGLLHIDFSYSLEFYETYISCYHRFVEENSVLMNELIIIKTYVSNEKAQEQKKLVAKGKKNK